MSGVVQLILLSGRPAWATAMAVALLTAGASDALAQGRRNAPTFEPALVVDEEAGREMLDDFRRQRLAGDYYFRFTLLHLPQRGLGEGYRGELWGSWDGIAPLSRVHVYPRGATVPRSGKGGYEAALDASRGHEPYVFFVRGGPRPETWMLPPGGREAREIPPDRQGDPLLPGLFFSAFDVQMPFVHWPAVEYEGKTPAGRTVHRYLATPPAGGGNGAPPGIAAVRFAIDDQTRALRTAEVIDASGEVAKEYKVENFKRVGEEYIVKQVSFLDEATRAKTRFKVVGAATGLSLPASVFDPAGPPRAPPRPPEASVIDTD